MDYTPETRFKKAFLLMLNIAKINFIEKENDEQKCILMKNFMLVYTPTKFDLCRRFGQIRTPNSESNQTWLPRPNV